MKTQSSSADIRSTGKLNARITANRNASRDFDEWCVRQWPELPLPARVLDLGAGTGKQVNLFAPLLAPGSQFFALDLEAKSLEALSRDYDAAPDLHLVEGSFDELDSFDELASQSFDLIYAAYALYYTADLARLVRMIHKLLKPGAVFWVVAPYTGTNAEFLEIVRPLHEVDPFMDYVFDEFHADVLARAEEVGFSSAKPSLLRNQIRFDDADSFLAYLSNSLFYQAGYDDEILRAVGEVCERDEAFTVSKNVISLQFRK